MDLRQPLLLLALGALACGSPFSEEGRSDGPPIGTIEVEIEARLNLGDTWDPDGYQVTGPGFAIHSDYMFDRVMSPGFPDGMQVRIRIEQIAEWCNVTPASQLITIRGADTIPTKFVITCAPLSRPVRFIFRSSGVRTDTSPVVLQLQGVGTPLVIRPGDTLRRMIPVGGGTVSTNIGGACRRKPTDPGLLEVPFYPSDTVNYAINRNCGVIRVQGDLQNGNTPQMLTEVTADSAWWTGVVNGIGSSWGTRASYSNSVIARARRRVNGGVTEWSLTRTAATAANEAFLRTWGTTFVGHPAWRRDNSRVDFLVQDSVGVTLWSSASGGGDLQPLSVPGTLRPGSPEWSPDGTRLAYVTDQGIAIAPLGAGVPEKLFVPTTSLTLTDPRWLPTGDTLIVAGAIDTVGGTQNALWRLDIASGTILQLTTPPVGKTDGQVDVSPDGKYLAFYRSSVVAPGEDGSPKLMVLSLMTGTLKEIAVSGTLQGDPMWTR